MLIAWTTVATRAEAERLATDSVARGLVQSNDQDRAQAVHEGGGAIFSASSVSQIQDNIVSETTFKR